MSSPPASAATRRFPSPCWAHEETLSLIKAYGDRWFALSRGNLRASDWEAVAAALASAGATDGAPKTSIQCRHKIEKLRQRYRAEKQRALSKPGRFFSTWDLFPVLDSMEIGVVGSVQDKHVDKAVKSGNIGRNHNPNVEIGRDSVLPGFAVKGNRVSKPTLAFDCNYGGGFSVKSRDDALPRPPGFAYRSSTIPDFDDSDDDSMCGFPVKSLGDRNGMPLASRSVHYGKIGSDRNCKPSIHYDYDIKCDDDDDGCGFEKRFSGDWKSGPSGLRSNSYYKKDGNTGSHMDYGVLNGTRYSTRSGFVKKSKGGVKRGRGAVSELVSSIKRLGEVFLKMEKMKMETMREIENMRMEIEIKHNEMILESHQQVVNVFTEAFVEKTQKKKVKTVSTNGDL